MTPRQFAEWREFYSINPWGPERADLRIGLHACLMQVLIAQCATWSPDDFVLMAKRDSSPTEPDPVEVQRTIDLQTAQLQQLGRLWETQNRSG